MQAIPGVRLDRVLSAVPLTFVAAIICIILLESLVMGQEASQPAATTARPLITRSVDDLQLTRLRGNTHPLARPEFDLGTAPATLPMDRMLLVLKRSREQETALARLLDDQQDKASPNYHKWLTPEQFGQQFGPTDTDIQTITAWLQSHGFAVVPTKGRTVLEFSGSASQVQEAFHTSIHRYIVNGEQHWANASDPQIPKALAPAVKGILTLHNFQKKPLLHISKIPLAAQINPRKNPTVTFPSGVHALAPADYATIYHINPIYASSGAGQGHSIAVVGRSNLFNGTVPGEDVYDFRQNFVPSYSAGAFQILLNGPDPGDLGGGDEAEATLDTTWSGALAPGAAIELVVSASTNTTDGVDLSEVYIIENNLADVMTESFSSCEAQSTSGDVAGVTALSEQAAAQGITYFVSTGDSGAEGCDDPNASVATGPVSVNLLASTAYDVAVGGTIFNENTQNSLYWSTTNTGNESALSYIPENAWNESCTTGTCAANAKPSLLAGGGGASIYVRKPAWQSAVTGIPQDNARDLPDVSLTAAGHDGYLLCLHGSCVPDSTGSFYVFLVSGTSASAPAFAGIMALVVQHMAILNPNQVPRQGPANYVLYRLAASQNATLSQCSASSTSGLPGSGCIFNDITVGNIAVPGELNYGLSIADYQAGVGYDMATGLGSVNVVNLVNQWSSVTFNATTTTLALNPLVNLTHGSPVNVNIAVSPSSGSGTPTGDVTLFAESDPIDCFGSIAVGDGRSLTSGSAVFQTYLLPGGGRYCVWAHYAGDATYAPSNSNGIQVMVSPEPSTTTLSVLSFDSQGNQFPFTNGSFGSFVYLRSDVAGQSGHGTPTGTVNLTDAFGPIPGGNSFQLSGGDTLHNGSYTSTPNGVTFDAGTHTISASYSGDSSFNTSASSPPITFTITPGFFASIPRSASEISISAPGDTGTSSVTVSNSTAFNGTITLSCEGLPSETTCTFTPATISATGAPNITTVSILVATKAATAMLNSQRPRYLPSQWTLGIGLLLSILPVGGKRRRARLLYLFFALILLATLPNCGGGGGSKSRTPPPDPGTPTGASNVTVTASSGSSVSTTRFALIVN